MACECGGLGSVECDLCDGGGFLRLCPIRECPRETRDTIGALCSHDDQPDTPYVDCDRCDGLGSVPCPSQECEAEEESDAG